ncbi:short-subunit dehydrogenase [Silvibacterium bohemicum]|uniref:Short-subunit dehydrogenase n=1 Tax=Silvibacterium bohemicum TaxID=1577686 RepID=A0A841JP70_9BACT|nr:SDR family oxidoreductase [Silvibacterium bohemicum]MBB6143162.1 short-subunit dehydrogenase [Silvibacterium bohemicum]
MKKSALPYRNVLLSLAAAGVVYAALPRPQRIRRGQVAVITGGSRGLGLAIAHELGKAGVKLVLAARDGDQLAAAKEQLLFTQSFASGDDVLTVPCDVSNKHQAATLIETAHRHFGAIDLLINDAGVIEVGPIEDQTIEAFETAMSINFFGALHTIYAAMPHFLARGEGAIVNISSIGGKIPVPHLLPYVASKFALVGLSEGLNAELRHKGIRVTTVCPGLMRTGGEVHAHFSGDVAKEKLWFQTSARTPLISANVTRAARKIVAAVNAGRAEITITPQAWLAARAAGVAPESTQRIASLINTYVLPEPVNKVLR